MPKGRLAFLREQCLLLSSVHEHINNSKQDGTIDVYSSMVVQRVIDNLNFEINKEIERRG